MSLTTIQQPNLTSSIGPYPGYSHCNLTGETFQNEKYDNSSARTSYTIKDLSECDQDTDEEEILLRIEIYNVYRNFHPNPDPSSHCIIPRGPVCVEVCEFTSEELENSFDCSKYLVTPMSRAEYMVPPKWMLVGVWVFAVLVTFEVLLHLQIQRDFQQEEKQPLQSIITI